MYACMHPRLAREPVVLHALWPIWMHARVALRVAAARPNMRPLPSHLDLAVPWPLPHEHVRARIHQRTAPV
jgi:hypothetical protein